MTPSDELGIKGIGEIERIDSGGAPVFRARQAWPDRLVAVKILDPSQKPLVPKRFDLRRRALTGFAELPGVVPIYEVGTTPRGEQYLLMPYYKTGSLDDQLRHGPMPWHRAAELTASVARIVAGAHAGGLILSDLKPSSILLADATEPVIAVYGMATRRSEGCVPAYSAPELKQGQLASPRSDVYSLCLILGALLSGRHPEPGEHPTDMLTKSGASAPARVIGTIQQGLSRDPDDRYHDAEAFADTLTSAIETLISNPVEPRDIGGNGDLDAAAQPLSVPGKPEAGITPRVNQSAFQAQDEEEVEDPFGIEALLEPPTENRTTSTTGGTLSSRSTRSEAMNTDEQGRRSSARHPQASILDLEASARFVKAPAIPRATSASRPLAGSTRASGKDWSSGNLDHEASSSIALFDLDRAEEAIGDDNESSSSPTNDGLNSLTDDISVPVDEEADIWVSADQCQDPEDRSGYTEVPNEIAGNGNEITANEPKSKGELRADWLTPLPDSHVDLPADQPPPPAAADTKPFTEQSPPTDNGSANADEERKPWVIGADQLWQVPDAPTNPEAITMANEDEQTASERDQARAENVTDGSQQPVRSIWDLPDDLDVGDDSPKLGESANRPTLDPEAMTRSLLFPDDGDHVDENWDIETHVSDPINNQGPPPMIPATAAIPLPFEVTGNTGPRSITSDESVPFRTFERQRLTHRQHSRAGQIMENLQASWYNRRRSVGGVIAVLSFAGLAGIVAALVVQDFRQSAANRTTTTSTTAATSSSQGETAGPIAIKPTGVPPVLSEPASTHASQASSATPKRVTTTVRRNQTSTTTPSSATSGVTTATSSTTASQSSSTTTPSSSSTVSSTTTSTASTGSTTTDPQPVTSVDTTVTPDPEGPTLPLIQGARADKIRPTSAQIRFESSACVTATFSYGPTGGGRSIISGGSDCNDAHVLLLGVVTEALEPATSYAVTITATSGSSTAHRTVSFTTLG